MPGPITVRNPTCQITFGTTVVDLSAHLRTVEPTSETEIIDKRTFAAPKQRDFGAQTDGFNLGLTWSPDLYDALSPFTLTDGALVLKYSSAQTKAIRATVQFGNLPWGPFEHGTAVEVDLPLIVNGDITYS